MTTASAQHLAAAKRLLAYEWMDEDGQAAAAGRVYDRIFSAFAPVLGAAGVRALFARSVRLSVKAFPCLDEVVDPAEPATDFGQRLVACMRNLDPDLASGVATGLYATLLDLMSNFIGERMVWQIVGSAFPGVDMAGLKEKEQ